jgi:hypothetical protein
VFLNKFMLNFTPIVTILTSALLLLVLLTACAYDGVRSAESPQFCSTSGLPPEAHVDSFTEEGGLQWIR